MTRKLAHADNSFHQRENYYLRDCYRFTVPSLVLVCFSSEHHFFFLVDYVIYATYVNYEIKYLTHKLHKASFVSKYSIFPKQKVFIRPLLSISTTPTSVSQRWRYGEVSNYSKGNANLRHKVPQTTIGTIIIW